MSGQRAGHTMIDVALVSAQTSTGTLQSRFHQVARHYFEGPSCTLARLKLQWLLFWQVMAMVLPPLLRFTFAQVVYQVSQALPPKPFILIGRSTFFPFTTSVALPFLSSEPLA